MLNAILVTAALLAAQVLRVCLPLLQGVPGARRQEAGCHQEQGQVHASR